MTIEKHLRTTVQYKQKLGNVDLSTTNTCQISLYKFRFYQHVPTAIN